MEMTTTPRTPVSNRSGLSTVQAALAKHIARTTPRAAREETKVDMGDGWRGRVNRQAPCRDRMATLAQALRPEKSKATGSTPVASWGSVIG